MIRKEREGGQAHASKTKRVRIGGIWNKGQQINRSPREERMDIDGMLRAMKGERNVRKEEKHAS